MTSCTIQESSQFLLNIDARCAFLYFVSFAPQDTSAISLRALLQVCLFLLLLTFLLTSDFSKIILQFVLSLPLEYPRDPFFLVLVLSNI